MAGCCIAVVTVTMHFLLLAATWKRAQLDHNGKKGREGKVAFQASTIAVRMLFNLICMHAELCEFGSSAGVYFDLLTKTARKFHFIYDVRTVLGECQQLGWRA